MLRNFYGNLHVEKAQQTFLVCTTNPIAWMECITFPVTASDHYA